MICADRMPPVRSEISENGRGAEAMLRLVHACGRIGSMSARAVAADSASNVEATHMKRLS
jgi:hypothetical protein